jgi:hypothetical protein
MEKLSHSDYALIEYALDNYIRNEFRGQKPIDIKQLEEIVMRRADILQKLARYIEEPTQ